MEKGSPAAGRRRGRFDRIRNFMPSIANHPSRHPGEGRGPAQMGSRSGGFSWIPRSSRRMTKQLDSSVEF